MSGEVEKTVQQGVFLSRWLLAPMYLGLALTLIVLLIQFVRDFFAMLPQLFQMTALEAVPLILTQAIVLLGAHAVLVILQTSRALYAPQMASGDPAEDGRGRLNYTRLRNRFLGMAIVLTLLLIFRQMFAISGGVGGLQPFLPLAALLGVLVGAALVLAVADWFLSLARRSES